MNRLVLRINRDGYFQGSLGRCLERKRVKDFFSGRWWRHTWPHLGQMSASTVEVWVRVFAGRFSSIRCFFQKYGCFTCDVRSGFPDFPPPPGACCHDSWEFGQAVAQWGLHKRFFLCVDPTIKLYLLTLVLIFEGIFREETFLYTCPNSHEF